MKNLTDTSNALSKKEIKRLIELGRSIRRSLECDINGQGIPCRTDRLASVRYMIEYLNIHNIDTIDNRN